MSGRDFPNLLYSIYFKMYMKMLLNMDSMVLFYVMNLLW